ncbi:MAG: type II toxin-antitoxin system HicA family toxin [Chitinophagaceae bacterium]|nr:type II toxin-antitoxin system HicA family toxin [Chitinophagaceae bacterium]
MSIKRNEFIQYLAANNCSLFRHGSKHDIYQNNITNKKTSIPRHLKLEKYTCQLICKQLNIPKI